MPKRYPGLHDNRTIVSLLMIRQSFRCYFCERKLFIGDPRVRHRATLEHLVSLVFGGEPFGANAVAACAQCNNLKGPLDAAGYAAVKDDHKQRRALIAEAQRRINAMTPLEKQMNYDRIRLVAVASREELLEALQPHLEEFKRARGGTGDALVLETSAVRHGGSTPLSRTNTDAEPGRPPAPLGKRLAPHGRSRRQRRHPPITEDDATAREAALNTAGTARCGDRHLRHPPIG